MLRTLLCRAIWWRFEGWGEGEGGRSLGSKLQPNKRHPLPIEFASAGSWLEPLSRGFHCPSILGNGVQATHRVKQQALLSTPYKAATTLLYHVRRRFVQNQNLCRTLTTRPTIFSKGG